MTRIPFHLIALVALSVFGCVTPAPTEKGICPVCAVEAR